LENSAVRSAKAGVARAGRSIAAFFRTLFTVGNRRYTVMLVPHSEKRVYNLHVTLFSMIFVLLALCGIVGSFFWYGAAFADTAGNLADKDGKLKDAQASLDQLRDETARLLKASRGFESALGATLSGLAWTRSSRTTPTRTGGPSSFFELKETAEGSLKEVAEVRRLAGTFRAPWSRSRRSAASWIPRALCSPTSPTSGP
jgi:hypothetical protein